MRFHHACISLVFLAGCALPESRSSGPDASYVRPPDVLRLENNSADLLRVYLELGERQLLVGRVDPFQRVALRLPPGVVNAGSGSARLLVVPLGTAQLIGANGLTGIRSDIYRATEFLEYPWEFSGTRIFMSLTRR